MSELQNENDVFSVMVSKAASGCLSVVEKDFKLQSLLLPKVGLSMFLMFVVIRLASTMAISLKETGNVGLLEILRSELQRISKG